MEQSEDIADLLADVAPLTDAEFDALAVADLATEAGQAPAGRQTAGQETGVGHGQRLVTRARRHRTYDLEAERKMGQMLKETERAKGVKCQLKGKNASGGHRTLPPEDDAPTLSALGLTKRESAEAQLQARGATLTSSRNHAKVIGLAFERDAYVVEGSANMRSCNNLEQFTLTNDPELFEFHRRWIQSI